MPGFTLPDGVTLKNRIGAHSHSELERREAALVKKRALQLAEAPPNPTFDTAHLKSIHRHLFQDIFEWAGHSRDEKLRLSDGMLASEPEMRKPGGKAFSPGNKIAPALKALFARLHKDGFLRSLDRSDFARQAAVFPQNLNTIHPFREGNGRTQRILLEQLAEQAGHDLDFTVVTRERMVRASMVHPSAPQPNPATLAFCAASA